MGTRSSDLSLITRKHNHTVEPLPVEWPQYANAERDVSDGGGGGLILFLLALALLVVAWWLI